MVQVKADGPGENEKRLKAPLIDAGIGLDEVSLVATLKHKEVLLSTRSALLLGEMKKSKIILDGLTDASNADSEALAVTSMISLLKLGDTNWLSTGSKRLRTMKEPVWELGLSAALARCGNTQGWKSTVKAINDPVFCSVALETISDFDGQTLAEGGRIDIIVELEKLEKLAAPANSRMIRAKRDQITAGRDRKK